MYMPVVAEAIPGLLHVSLFLFIRKTLFFLFVLFLTFSYFFAKK